LYRLKGSKQIDFGLRKDINYTPPPGFKGDVTKWDGMIVGSGVIGLQKDEKGQIDRPFFIYQSFVGLTVLPLDPENSNVDLTRKAQTPYWIIDDSRTKVYLYDSNTVYVPFKTLQRDLDMDGHDNQPARTSDIQIALNPGVDLE